MNLYDEIAFRTSRLITRKYSTSFSIAVSFLPPDMRRAIYNIYAFVRFADEIVDTFTTENRELLLMNFERDYNEVLENNISMNPVLHSFALTVKQYNIPLHLVESFLKSMKYDLSKSKYYNMKELDEYIYGSADVVGLMCLKVFVNGNEKLYYELEKPAMKLGSAFQKVNFLRDIKADTELLNRTYFPEFDADTFDESAKYKLIENIEKDFAEAREGIKRLPGKSKLAVLIAFVYYRHLLKKLTEARASEIMNKRIRLAGYLKTLLFAKAFLKYRLNRI